MPFALLSLLWNHTSAKVIDCLLAVGAVVLLGWYLLSMHDKARDAARDLAEQKVMAAQAEAQHEKIEAGLTQLNTATQAALMQVASIKAAAHAAPQTTGCINSPAVGILRQRLSAPAAAGAGAAAAHP
jgi:predicted negative regulator of RcsB-dependent stress response